MNFERKSGVLLHISSLPDSFGIGTIGKNAYKFVDWLHESSQKLWQILPIGPTGYGDSPYASFSTFAGNPLFVDLDNLVEKGWASKKDIVSPDYIKKDGNVDFSAVVWWKTPVLTKCALYFMKNASLEDKSDYNSFCDDNINWINEYALFMSIKLFYDEKAKNEKVNSSVWNLYWPKELASHNEDALTEWKKSHEESIEVVKIIQFFFDYQWKRLKKYANEKGIQLIGDIPIFVASDSSDVWSNQKLFQLDENGRPYCVSGVPPDYFSAEGQLWGNPLYDWNSMKKDNYSWWISRIKRIFELTDCLRIDHFRGFEAYWSVLSSEKTAMNGKWVSGPGIDLFNTIKSSLGDLPIIAEDLGLITESVRKLREDAGFPGMKVLQFAFSPEEAKSNGMVNCFLPHQYENSDCVVYTGTHDNETLQGWLSNTSDEQLELIASYVEGKRISLAEAKKSVKNKKLGKKLIQIAFSSTAKYAIIPMQDVLCLGNESRMNIPSTANSNWSWRMGKNDLKKSDAEMLSFYSTMYGRS